MAVPEERFDELRLTAEVVGKLAEDAEAFAEAVEAVRAQDVERFQDVLGRLGLLEHCWLICRYLCTKHCVFVCGHLVGDLKAQEFDIDEMREFAQLTAKIARDKRTMNSLVRAVDNEDREAFQRLVKRLEIGRFAHQLCHWVCAWRCRWVCEVMCPPPPLITAVGYITTSQFDTQGYASGPSNPGTFTPADNFGAGIGHHPFGGLTHVNGVFNVAGATEYKVEFSANPGGPWSAITTPIQDARWVGMLVDYVRTATGDWYDISDMGLRSEGMTYLTDWQTPGSAANDTYYLKLTVRNAALTEFESPVYPVRIDNEDPTVPSISLALKSPDGTVTPLGCCEEVEQGDGNTVIVTIQTEDENFSSVRVRLRGGCGVALPIVDINGVPLSKTYDGNLSDTGYPAPTSFEWDPWGQGVDPCCYLVEVTTWDRAVVGNQWSGRHWVWNWHSITIA